MKNEWKEFMKDNLPLVCIFCSILNVPLMIILSAYDTNGISQTIIIAIECIVFGFIIIHSRLKYENKIISNYKKCIGTIMDIKFNLFNGNWLKTPIVVYEVDNKKYKTRLNFGINGIFSFLVKDSNITVYYNPNNPKDVFTRSIVEVGVGSLFIFGGIVILLKMLIIYI